MSDRRRFLQQSGVLIGGVFISSMDNRGFESFSNRIAASDQVNIGAIGINGMGWADVTSALKVPGVNLVALCDVDKNVLDKRMSDLAKLNVDASKIKIYGDYRKLLEQKDVDAF